MIMINHHINRARQNTFQAFYDYSWCAIENIADSLSLPHSCCSCVFFFLHLIHMRAHILILKTVGHIISGSLSTQFSLNSTENALLSTQLILMMQWNGFYFGFLFYLIFFCCCWKDERAQEINRTLAIVHTLLHAKVVISIQWMNEWTNERMREFKKSNKSSFIGVCLCHWSHCISRIYEWIAFILSFLCQ